MSAIMDALLTKLREAIDTKAISVRALARECSVSHECIYKVLRGDSQPSVSLAEKMALAIGLEFTLKNATRKKISA